MGKNHGKKKQETRYAKWQSIMSKLDNQLKLEEELRKRTKKKDSKTH